MATEPEHPPHVHEPDLDVLRSGASPRQPRGGRVEAQLRGRIEQLEAALADATRCLEQAEQRGAELEATQARLAALEQRLAVIVGSKSWRLTTPLRRAMERARPSERS